MNLYLKTSLLVWVLFLTGCNHLLYPAERQPFVVQKSLRPVPQDIYIPINKNNESSYLHAWFFPAQSKIKKGLVVHFHGNGQNLTTHFLFMSWIVDYGYDYLIFDYRGYGASSDELATQGKTIEDGLAVFRYLHENHDKLPIIAFGQSLGSNVLVRTLQELNKRGLKNRMPSLVVLDSSFLSYQQAGVSVMGQRWFLYPLKPLIYLVLSDEWSAYNLTEYTPPLPALFFHGTQDGTIDYKLGQKNFEHWPGAKVFVKQQDGGHTSAFGDLRFVNSRDILLSCINYVIKMKEPFADCVK